MHPLLNSFSDVNQSGLGALGVNVGSFITQIISFVIVFLILKRFAFKPILKIMDERRKTIDSGVNLGIDMKKKSAELEEEVADKLREARVKADSIIDSAQEEARGLVSSAEEDAKKKVDQISKEAQEKIKLETAKARKELEKEIVGLISEATEAIIDEKVDSKKDAELIDKVLHQRSAS
jgi:F-type H+-transporting ATPase subunit b